MKISQNTNIGSFHVATAVLLIVTVSCLATLTGCGDGRPDRVPVSGQVLIDGKPLTYGTVRVIPQNARAATGTIQPDGSFKLTTFEDGDGVVPGEHVMVIDAGNQISQTQMKWYAPKRYAKPQTSGQKLPIDKSTDSLKIKLTWKGSPHNGPFVERVN
ncbi:MAG: hypothetical protein PVH19_09575 [Planctomycetia bacterium]|jgi:hypothetical protein